MTESDDVVISSNGQLTLAVVKTDHEGEWRCQATSSSGSNEARTNLTVKSTQGMCTYTVHTFHSSIHGVSLAKPMPSPRPGRRHRPIPANDFGIHVNMLHESSNKGFKEEYEVNVLMC